MPTIHDEIATALSTLGPRTRSQVVEHYASKEADKQAAALIKVKDQIDTARKDLQRIKPQVSAYDESGEPVGVATFTKDQIDQRKKLNEQIDKLTKAFDKADEKGDFGDLYNLANKGKSDEPKDA